MTEQIVTVYQVLADGNLVDVTTDANKAEQHSVDFGRDVYAETARVSL